MKTIFCQILFLLATAVNASALEQPALVEEPEIFIMRHPTERVASPHYQKPGMSQENKRMHERYKKAHAQWQARGRVGAEPQLIWEH